MTRKIEMQSLRFALLLGALAGAIFGVLSSQPLSAWGSVAEVGVPPSCRILCESVTWLRAPIRYRTSGAGNR